MSELINGRAVRHNVRSCFLVTTSMLVLIGGFRSTAWAQATDDETRSTLWIELGGQLERITGGSQNLSPPFMPSLSEHNLSPPVSIQSPAKYSYGEEGRISLQPHGSAWEVSAAIRYGRSNGNKGYHAQTAPPSFHCYLGTLVSQTCPPPKNPNFSDTKADNQESHMILDFMAGRDVGLGMMGSGSSATLELGVRSVQFSSRSDLHINTVPDGFIPQNLKYSAERHLYDVAEHNMRSFRGIGPSVSLSGTARLTGNREDGQILFDWSSNASVLFGRQRAHVEHTTADTFYTTGLLNPIVNDLPKYNIVHYPPHIVNVSRSKTVVVPNIGATAGLSFRYASAKVSFGYRADFFFGAMDTGIDTRKTSTVGFFGPFATISIGLGG